MWRWLVSCPKRGKQNNFRGQVPGTTFPTSNKLFERRQIYYIKTATHARLPLPIFLLGSGVSL